MLRRLLIYYHTQISIELQNIETPPSYNPNPPPGRRTVRAPKPQSAVVCGIQKRNSPSPSPPGCIVVEAPPDASKTPPRLCTQARRTVRRTAAKEACFLRGVEAAREKAASAYRCLRKCRLLGRRNASICLSVESRDAMAVARFYSQGGIRVNMVNFERVSKRYFHLQFSLDCSTK